MSETPYLDANIERFMGYAALYARYRPALPSIFIDILTQLARSPRPKRVVDLGSGTGLSTRLWAGRADEVIGIEPSDDMRRQAEQEARDATNLRYMKGLSIATGLPDGCADIVTASQALHWMEPVGTFAEVARILRPGGLFAAIDNDWPPTYNLEAEAADEAFMALPDQLLMAGEQSGGARRWNKDGHLGRIKESGHFRFVKEIAIHHVEQGNAERAVGLALSQGGIQTLLKEGKTEEEIGVPRLRADMQRLVGDTPQAWYITYRVRIGMK